MNTQELQLAIALARDKAQNAINEYEDARDFYNQKYREMEAAEEEYDILLEME